jgi:hypothetical protein
MAEELAQGKTESLIQVTPEFVEVVAAAIRSRRTQTQDSEVEGHALGVEEFSAESGINAVCGLLYAAN